jgi:peptidoglycan LD-endopeptidase CwlK
MIRPASRLSLPLCCLGLLAILLNQSLSARPAGTMQDPIVDSKMTEAETFDGLDPQCPKEIRDQQKVVAVLYWGFDHKVHRGQIVIDMDLEKDVVEVFELALKQQFPLQSVIPLAHPTFRKDHLWNDALPMAANNTSGFNFRPATSKKTLSNHAYGRALDINPLQNPYIKGDLVLPPGAKYNAEAEGTLSADHPITKAFLDRGWHWGATGNRTRTTNTSRNRPR